MTDQSVFDRLVLSLDNNERQVILRQIAETTEIEQSALIEKEPQIDLLLGESLSPQEKFASEHFFVRLWFSFKAFFSHKSSYQLYSLSLVNKLGSQLSKKWSEYIDIPRRHFTASFLEKLVELKRIQSFFIGLLQHYQTDKGSFYFVLATLLIPETSQKISEEANPIAKLGNEKITQDMRSSFLRNLELSFTNIPEQDKNRMYQAAQSIEWINMFCELPIERMIMRFSSVNGGSQDCLISSISSELQSLVQVLSSAKRIPVLLLECMYLFSFKSELENDKVDIESNCKLFVSKASSYLSSLRFFKTSVPLADFTRYAIQDVSWNPSSMGAGEDWFFFFKNAWKKKFDDNWALWAKQNKRLMLEKRIEASLNGDQLPELQYTPWKGLWIPLLLRRELSFRYLKGFFTKTYPKTLMKNLKIILIEGDFYRRENLAEFTDAFNTLDHTADSIANLETRLSPKGDLGEGFELLQKEKVATVRGKTRLENLMLTVNAEVDMLIGNVSASFKSMDLIIGGILSPVRGGLYETLVNLASIQGRYNEVFRKDLTVVRQKGVDLLEILSELELIERDSL